MAGSDTTSGLECSVGKARIALPLTEIAQIIEYDVAYPMPLLGRFIAGLSIHDDRVIISISLIPREEEGVGRRRARAVLLARSGETGVAWAFEVTEVRQFVRVTSREHPRPSGQRAFPSWVSVRQTTGGGAVGWIEVEEMLAELREAR